MGSFQLSHHPPPVIAVASSCYTLTMMIFIYEMLLSQNGSSPTRNSLNEHMELGSLLRTARGGKTTFFGLPSWTMAAVGGVIILASFIILTSLLSTRASFLGTLSLISFPLREIKNYPHWVGVNFNTRTFKRPHPEGTVRQTWICIYRSKWPNSARRLGPSIRPRNWEFVFIVLFCGQANWFILFRDASYNYQAPVAVIKWWWGTWVIRKSYSCPTEYYHPHGMGSSN